WCSRLTTACISNPTRAPCLHRRQTKTPRIRKTCNPKNSTLRWRCTHWKPGPRSQAAPPTHGPGCARSWPTAIWWAASTRRLRAFSGGPRKAATASRPARPWARRVQHSRAACLYRSTSQLAASPPTCFHPHASPSEQTTHQAMNLIVHHLNNSRSQRVLWMLEELDLPYDIRTYQRNASTMLAPPELKAVHPLGKSPVLEDDGIQLVETGAICEYLVGKANGRLGPVDQGEGLRRYRQFLHYAEGSVMP